MFPAEQSRRHGNAGIVDVGWSLTLPVMAVLYASLGRGEWWRRWLIAGMFCAWGALALTGPAVMLYLLFRVTGIPATEAQAIRSKGDDYRRYQATTSVFVPWFPRSAS